MQTCWGEPAAWASLGGSRDGSGVGQLGHAEGHVLVGHVDLGVGVEAVAVHLALDLRVGAHSSQKLLGYTWHNYHTEAVAHAWDRSDCRSSCLGLLHRLTQLRAGCMTSLPQEKQEKVQWRKARLKQRYAPCLHELLHGGRRVLLGGALDEDIILGPHEPADGVACILHAHMSDNYLRIGTAPL